MTNRIFIWVGHPRLKSLCAGIADAYQAGAERNGSQVRRMNLSEMSFEMDAFSGYDATTALLDRALEPGFGFKYHSRGVKWDKLLKGKSADAIITSDTPPLVDTLIYRKPARRVMKNQVFGFCGIKARSIVQFGSVKTAGHQKVSGRVGKAERMGASAAA